MPLSEEEQRLLAELEQALAAEDPKFASTLRGSRMRTRQRRLAIAAGCAFALGIVLLMTGVIIKLTPVSIVGFVVMLASAYIGIVAWRKSNQPEQLRLVGGESGGQTARAKPKTKSSSSASFMARMEERWRRRRESGY